jgi:hypothetical protein
VTFFSRVVEIDTARPRGDGPGLVAPTGVEPVSQP